MLALSGVSFFGCAGCKNLIDLTVSARNLRKLNLHGCHRLTAMQLKACALEELNAARCCDLHSFKGATDFPGLKDLNLNGCWRLSPEAGVVFPQAAGQTDGHVATILAACRSHHHRERALVALQVAGSGRNWLLRAAGSS